jgi:hypothetical protein
MTVPNKVSYVGEFVDTGFVLLYGFWNRMKYPGNIRNWIIVVFTKEIQKRKLTISKKD